MDATSEEALVEETTENSLSDDQESIKPNDTSNNRKFKFCKSSLGTSCLYITSCEKSDQDKLDKIHLQKLKTTVPNLNLEDVIETEKGLILNHLNDTIVKRILKVDLAKVFGKPIQALPLYSSHYRKIVCFKDIPWCICNEELDTCLKKQGVSYTRLTREKSTTYIEVSDYFSYQHLKEVGINFYDSVVFQSSDDTNLNEEVHYNTDNIIQCYKCQGFWHTANTCKQNIRCVRCGEEHSVEVCNRPKSCAICCNCKGPHHAAYKLCPVRLKLKKTVRVAFTYDKQYILSKN
ncbi:unnamed protein product [Callosobruchus maculatus]|uniref:Pre-C2HC domain-containing protein n=1 Tax=Callosobruchus maculatus TaxID=64391 RepID=A0A653BML9_CALMS|nr:unnamed protein product [Callosobruchus maculatus]